VCVLFGVRFGEVVEPYHCASYFGGGESGRGVGGREGVRLCSFFVIVSLVELRLLKEDVRAVSTL